MEKQYFAVTSDMIEPLNAIGISVTDHTLYFTNHIQGCTQDHSRPICQHGRRAK
jgi:hypothetical protein